MNQTIGGALLFSLLAFSHAQAETFILGGNANGLHGTPGGTLVGSDIDLTLAVGTPGAVINESDSDGLGIDSRGIAGVIDDSDSKLNVLGGAAAGQGESLTFSFNIDGVLDSLLFDGIKDETLEYFALELPNGSVLSLFDFEVELRLNDQGFALADMGAPNPRLSDGPSDDFSGLAIPFAAGDTFTLTYGEIDYDGTVLPGYFPADDNLNPTGDLPNGSRFEGVVASPVPEPSSIAISALAIGVCTAKRRT